MISLGKINITRSANVTSFLCVKTRPIDLPYYFYGGTTSPCKGRLIARLMCRTSCLLFRRFTDHHACIFANTLTATSLFVIRIAVEYHTRILNYFVIAMVNEISFCGPFRSIRQHLSRLIWPLCVNSDKSPTN